MSNEELNEHRLYVDDAVKMARYRAAINAVVRPGDVVLDLGAGTGLLGLMAAQAGASRVYAVDAGSILGLCAELAHANGFGAVVVPVRGMSTQVTLPEPVDVIVGDQLGGMGFDAGVNDYYADAARRLLKPGGKTVPERYSIGLAPVEAAAEYETVEFWRRHDGLDFREVRKYAANSVRPVRFAGDQLLGPTVDLVELEAVADVDIDVITQLVVARAGTLHGLLGTFRATMAPGIEMTNDPSSAEPMKHRWQDFLPLHDAVPVAAGDQVDVRLRASPSSLSVSWRVTVTPLGSAAPSYQGLHSTMAGTFAEATELRENRPGRRVGTRADRLEVVSTAVDLLASFDTAEQVERELAARFPERFGSGDEATLLVKSLSRLLS
jgi:protein arginine N-methyltransferase 1